MYFKISWDEEFDTLMMHLWGKYGKELFTIDGIGEQMDLNKFSKKFFKEASTTADVSIDANANVTARTGIEYNHEVPKPLRRYNSYYLLWKELRRVHGLGYANHVVEAQLTGDIYINDFTDVCSPYCFNYSTFDIAVNGLQNMSSRLTIYPPKSLDTFIRQVEQFLVVAANSTLGATGLADFLLVASHFVDIIKKTGYDGHTQVTDLDAYVHEKLVNFIYTVNWEFRGNQSPFSNISVYDQYFLENLCPDYVIDGKPTTLETVQWLQELYLKAVNQELARTILTFPITTACFSTGDNNEIRDEKFLDLVAQENLKYGYINFFMGKSSVLSSCCRLRSDRDTEYFNSFGAGSTKIGSLGVVTVNFPRAAARAHGDVDEFLSILKQLFIDTENINSAKRRLIKERIELGAAPLYTMGYMELSRQYSTFGVTGLNEAISILGYDILDEEGQELVLEILNNINEWISEAEQRQKAPHNCEQVPGESSTVKLAKKDKYMGLDFGVPLYSNQFIPLTVQATMLDRIRLQGKFDKLFSGGAICHVNIGEEITDKNSLKDLIRYAAKQGVVYWAVNYRLHVCAKHHTWVGTETCPVCGERWVDEITRVVGFFTSVKNWNPTRREVEWPKRQFYSQDVVEDAVSKVIASENIGM